MASNERYSSNVWDTVPERQVTWSTAWATTQICHRIRDGLTDSIIPLGGNKGKLNARRNMNGEWRFRRHSRRSVIDNPKNPTYARETLSESMYQYSPLPSTNHIRLLHLQPGLSTSPIQCIMSINDLDHVPAYKALSYNWGQKIRHQIQCDNVETRDRRNYLPIYESSWLALQRLRHETEERTLWIDAVCINQTNNAEKNDQVLLMRRIFQGAETVIVWLGEESQDSASAFDLVSRIVAAIALEQDFSLVEKQRSFKAEDLIGLSLPESSSPVWTALDSLFWRPWFNRVWVLQEIAVARSASVLCGQDHCQWSDLTATACYIKDHSLTAITQVDPRRALKYADLSLRYHEGSLRSLLRLLSEARDSYSTDDRDKVFALLGIAEDTDYGLLWPNYKKPLVDVYTTLTKCFIHRDRNLDILSAVEDQQFRLRRNRKTDQHIDGLEGNELPMKSQLPTWVPDWEVHRPSSPLLLHSNFAEMRAAGSTAASCTFSADSLRMHSRGIAFDQVAYVANTFAESVPAQGSLFPEPPSVSSHPSRARFVRRGFLSVADRYAVGRTDQWEKMARDLKTYPTGEDCIDAFIKTLVAGDRSLVDLSKEMRSAFYIAWRKYCSVLGMRKHLSVSEDPSALNGFDEKSPPEDLVLASQFLQAQLKAAYGRRFFTTSKGYMGLAQSGVRLGNTVVVLHGGKTPYLLQKVRSKGYRFVGECYIHGLMNGEALTRSIPEQVFSIF